MDVVLFLSLTHPLSLVRLVGSKSKHVIGPLFDSRDIGNGHAYGACAVRLGRESQYWKSA